MPLYKRLLWERVSSWVNKISDIRKNQKKVRSRYDQGILEAQMQRSIIGVWQLNGKNHSAEHNARNTVRNNSN